MSSTVSAVASPTAVAVAASFVTTRRRISDFNTDVERPSPVSCLSEEDEDNGFDSAGLHVIGLHHHHRLKIGVKRPWCLTRSAQLLIAAVVSVACLTTVILATSILKVTRGEEYGGRRDGWLNGNRVIHGGVSGQNNVLEEVSVVQLRAEISTSETVNLPFSRFNSPRILSVCLSPPIATWSNLPLGFSANSISSVADTQVIEIWRRPETRSYSQCIKRPRNRYSKSKRPVVSSPETWSLKPSTFSSLRDLAAGRIYSRPRQRGAESDENGGACSPLLSSIVISLS